jgi:hypothetical protein
VDAQTQTNFEEKVDVGLQTELLFQSLEAKLPEEDAPLSEISDKS